MNSLRTPHHSGPEEMPNTSRYLTDAEYRIVQNNIVIGCTDVLVVDKETGEALSGYRQQKPQEGYWFSCGGRMKRGQSYQEAGAAKIKEELGLEIDPARLEFLTAYSTAFNERTQSPSDEGVHTSNAVVTLFVTPSERAKMELKLNDEHKKAEWVPLEEIENKDEEFPAVLQDAIARVESSLCRDLASLYRNFASVAIEKVIHDSEQKPGFTNETVGFPPENFIVPKNHVFFDVNTRGVAYSDNPWLSSINSYKAGDQVAGTSQRAEQNPSKFNYNKNEGVSIAPGETKEVTTRLLGIPVTTLLKNEDGAGLVLTARELPQELVSQAMKSQEVFTTYGCIPSDKEIANRIKLEREIINHLKSGHTYDEDRKFTEAAA